MSKVIAVDFDGTLCEDNWPFIGKPNTDLISWLLKRKEMGDKLILWTCREGDPLDLAVSWCREHSLHFDAINDNLPERIAEWGDSRKISADWYIDDRGLSCFDLPFVAKGV